MLQNKYNTYYFNIIDRARNRSVSGYVERHHIFPKSLGGSNDKDNIVSLTAREHFVCHLLLTKMTQGDDKRKMIHAAWAMANLQNSSQTRYKITSRLYETLRESYATVTRERLKGKPGRKHSEETKKKIAQAHLGKKKHPMSEESKRKLSESMKGKNVGKKRTAEQSKAQSIRQTGKKRAPLTQEVKQKIRKSLMKTLERKKADYGYS